MSPSVGTLLSQLPQYRDEWIVIHDNQSVKDIIHEVLNAHSEFSNDYDKISKYFDKSNTQDICKGIAVFLSENVRYKEEPEESQTSALPGGLLTRKHGDCKHYAGFSAGILDSIKRLTGKKIDWKYRFASYDPFYKTPHHVFVVVNDGENEITIDPTPGAMLKTPYWIVDQTVKKSKMPLLRNIAGIDDQIGYTDIRLVSNVDNINFDGSGKYSGVFNPYLGLSNYHDFGGGQDDNALYQRLADEINSLVPGSAVNSDFVKWIYYNNIRSWNFLFPNGVRPGFSAENILPAGYPKLVVTQDGRLDFDRDVQIDDYRNAEIHILTAWAQSLINQYDDQSPYPITPKHLKEFSQGKFGGYGARNIFSEPRGTNFFQAAWNTLTDVVEFVGQGVIKIIGSIPRNAFLALVGLNVFNIAANMQRSIDNGEWEEIASKWEKIGGNPDKLYNTIQDGKDKNAILGNANTIGAEPATTAAWLAAAAPILALFLKWIDKDGKATEILAAAKGFVQTQYPDVDLDAFGFLDRATGQYLDIRIDDQDNELLGGGSNDMPSNVINWKTWLLPIGLGVGAYYLFFKKKKITGMRNDKTIYLLGGGLLLLLLMKKNNPVVVEEVAAPSPATEFPPILQPENEGYMPKDGGSGYMPLDSSYIPVDAVEMVYTPVEEPIIPEDSFVVSYPTKEMPIAKDYNDILIDATGVYQPQY